MITSVESESSSLSAVRQVSRTGEFELACDADRAFPLFSPEGERGWIPTWKPRAIFPATIEFRRDTVFGEGLGAEEAIWTIVDVDWSSYRAEYVRVAPGSHAAHIVVKIDARGVGCRAVVSYTVTLFGADGARVFESFSDEAFAAKMRSWQRQIADYLKSQTS